nr:MAG TPA: hypothetical protein [Caudoviricetes sp.]
MSSSDTVVLGAPPHQFCAHHCVSHSDRALEMRTYMPPSPIRRRSLLSTLAAAAVLRIHLWHR